MRSWILLVSLVLTVSCAQAWRNGNYEVNSKSSSSAQSSSSHSHNSMMQQYVDNGNGLEQVMGSEHHDSGAQKSASHQAEAHGFAATSKGGWNGNQRTAANKWDSSSSDSSNSESHSASDKSYKHQITGGDYDMNHKYGKKNGKSMYGNKYAKENKYGNQYDKQDMYGNKYDKQNKYGNQYDKQDIYGNKYNKENKYGSQYDKQDMYGNKYDKQNKYGNKYSKKNKYQKDQTDESYYAEKQGGWQNNNIQGVVGNTNMNKQQMQQNQKFLSTITQSEVSREVEVRRTTYKTIYQQELQKSYYNKINIRQVMAAIVNIKNQLHNLQSCQNTGEQMATKIMEELERMQPNVPWYVDSPVRDMRRYRPPTWIGDQDYEWVYTEKNICSRMDRGWQSRFFAIYPIIDEKWKVASSSDWSSSQSNQKQRRKTRRRYGSDSDSDSDSDSYSDSDSDSDSYSDSDSDSGSDGISDHDWH